jgi:hypothetical protein
MATLTPRQKLITYLADAEESEIDALYNVLMKSINNEKHFIISDEELKLLEVERELHLSGKSKSYTREESIQIIKGQREF